MSKAGNEVISPDWIPALTFRTSLALLISLQIVLLAAVGLPGKNVIFPNGNSVEVGADSEPVSEWINNRKFSDLNLVYLPTLEEQLQGDRSGWISTWNPHQQLGQPLLHVGGISKAYPPTLALSLLISDPLQLYSLLFVATLMASGMFMFLFLHELRLSPVACLVGAMSICFGVYFLYWSLFLVMISGICWTTALLWLITKYVRDRSFLSAAGVSFSVYALLLSAYPQQIVLFGYLLVLYGGVTIWRVDGGLRRKARLVLVLLLCASIGVIASLPLYLDTYETAQRSARLKTDLDFFISVLPRLDSLRDVLLYVGRTVSPFWFGNPVRPDYPFKGPAFNGVGLGLFSFWLFAVAVLAGGRRLWPWYLFVALSFLATVCLPVYVVMNGYMGFHFSRCVPSVGAVIPLAVLGSYAADALCRGLVSKTKLLIAVSVTLVFAAAVPFLAGGVRSASSGLLFAASDLAVVAMLAVASFTRYRQASLVLAMLVSSLIASQTLVLARPPSSIHLTSTAVDSVRMHTDNGNSRFAKVGGDIYWFIPSGQEALHGLRSIHSFDSLSSQNYQRLARKISTNGTALFGRVFHVAATEEKLNSEDISLMGISLVLSKTPLSSRCLSFLAEVQGIRFYRPVHLPVLEMQTETFSASHKDAMIVYGEALAHQMPVSTNTGFDDLKVFRTTAVNRTTLLFISEQYHPRWRAYAGNQHLRTVTVNDFFLGVVVPPQTTSVAIRFEPLITWSWIPQVFYLALFIAGLFVARMRRQSV